MFHSRAVPSLLPLAMVLPSGLNATLYMVSDLVAPVDELVLGEGLPGVDGFASVRPVAGPMPKHSPRASTSVIAPARNALRRRAPTIPGARPVGTGPSEMYSGRAGASTADWPDGVGAAGTGGEATGGGMDGT